MKLIRDRLKVAQSRQKSYADSKHKETIYEVGDRANFEYLHFEEQSVLELKGS